MADIDDAISLIEGKLNRVVHFSERIYSENEELKRRVEALSGLLDEKNHEVKVLETRYQNLKLTKTMVSSADDVSNVKHQVNRMVREIDKCIALLNR